MPETSTGNLQFATDENEAEAGPQPRGGAPGEEKIFIKDLSYLEQELVPDLERDEPFARYCSDSAHVWKLYMDGAKVWDDELANVLNGDLDPLLIFAGLFSAILSAFLIEIRKGLQEDLQDTTNTLLRIIIQDQQNLTVSPISPFKPTSSSRWVNGLWFSSLIFSLMSALGASLAKGWVTQYASTGFGTSWRDASSHRRRYTGMNRWRMKVIIQGLPIFIHVAFFLFAAGLIILLIQDDIGIAGVISALVIIIVLLYLGSTAHPLYSLDSPFRTPVSNIINWLADISKAKAKLLPLTTGDTDPAALKAQALSWLLTESADIKVIEEAVHAIAGLPTKPSVQDELYQSSVVSILSRGLSECIRSHSRDSDTLNAYLHAILRLVQAGPMKYEQRDDSAGHVLISLVENGGPLQLSRCAEFEHGLREIALCINARIRLMLFEKYEDAVLFKTDLPVLLKSSTQRHTRRLLFEVYLLSSNIEESYRGFSSTNNFPRTLLEMLKSGDAQLRNDGHKQLLQEANLEEVRTTAVTTFGIGSLLEGLSSDSESVRDQYLEAFLKLCIHVAFRQQIREHGGIRQLCSLIKGNNESAQKKAIEILTELAKHDDTHEALAVDDIMKEMMGGLKHEDIIIQRNTLGVLMELSTYGDMRLKIWTPELIDVVVNVIIAIITSGTYDTRRRAIDTAGVLAGYDNIALNILKPQLIDTITACLEDKAIDVSRAAFEFIGKLAAHNSLRVGSVTHHVINIIVEALGNKSRHLREAAIAILEILVDHHDIRKRLVAPEITRKIMDKLGDDESDVSYAAIVAIQKLLEYDDICSILMTPAGIEKIKSRLGHSKFSVRRQAIEIFEKLVDKASVRADVMTPDIINAIIENLSDEDSVVRRTTTSVVGKLVKYDDHEPKRIAPDVTSTIMRKLGNERWAERQTGTRLLTEFVANDDLRGIVMGPQMINEIFSMLEDEQPNAREEATKILGSLAMHDDSELQSMLPKIMKAIMANLLDKFSDVRQATVNTIKLVSRRDNIRTQYLTSDVISDIVATIRDEHWRIRWSAIQTISSLTDYADIWNKIMPSNIMDAAAKMLRDENSVVRWAAVGVIDKLASHNSDIRANIITPNLINEIIANVQDEDLEALEVIGKLAGYDDIRSRIMTPEVISVFMKKLLNEDAKAIEIIGILADHVDIRSKIVTLEMLSVTVRRLADDRWAARKTVIGAVGRLITHNDVRLKLVTLMIHNILNMLGHRQFYVREAAITLLSNLTQYNDIHATLSAPAVISSAISSLKGASSDTQTVYEGALVILLTATPISPTGFKFLISFLEDPDPIMVRISLQVIPRLAKQDHWRPFIRHWCKTDKLTDLLNRHDMRSSAVQSLQGLGQYDDICGTIKNDSGIVQRLLEMLKSKASDIERWRLGVEGLLALGLF